MNKSQLVKTRVSQYYWENDFNCATTTLKILSETFALPLSEQVIDAAIGMHGAGQYGAQCGLVEGTLMFLGILGRENGVLDDRIIQTCRDFAVQFESRFGSLQCSVLRPQGFHPDNPPHICEPFTCKAVEFSIDFISALADTEQTNKYT